jgi:PAS domain S-box-containing protein
VSKGFQQVAAAATVVRDGLPNGAGRSVIPPSVLVIEATPLERCAAFERLQAEDWDIERTASLEEAVRRSVESPPDCILIGDCLSQTGVIEAIERLRRPDTQLPAAIILLGADGDLDLATTAMKAGVLDVIPYRRLDAATLGEAIRTASARFRINEERWRRARENAQLAAIVTSSSDAILSIDADAQHVRSWSPAATSLFGYTEQEAVGRTVDDLLVPDHKRDERARLKASIGLGRPGIVIETERRHKSGALIPVEINVSPMSLTPGVLKGYSVIFRDITERRRAQERIRESQEQLARREAELSRAQRIARIGSYEVHCSAGKFSNRRSPEYLAIHGLPPEAWNEPHEAWVARMHPDDRGWAEAAFKKAVADGAREYEAEYRIIRPSDGALRWIKVLAEIDRDEVGRAVRLFGTHIDITERKQAEENVRLLMREVNHRAKNMLGLVQAVARQTVATNAKEFLQRFEERIAALAKSQDLLVKSEWKGVDLQALARSQLAHLQDAIDDRRIALAGPPVSLTAAAAQTIGMAFHELATNAAKYGALSTSNGLVALSWQIVSEAAGEPRLRLTWVESGGPAVVPPTRRGFGSTITGRMAQMNLGGEATITYPASGLQWHLDCPVSRIVDGAALADSQNLRTDRTELVPSGRPRILVVEDEALVAVDISEQLVGFGCEVIGPAATVSEAMALIQEGSCDAAVLDVNLGRETSEPVATELIRRAIPFLAVSGYSRDQQPFIFRSCPLLSKPLQREQFASGLSRILVSDRHTPL